VRKARQAAKVSLAAAAQAAGSAPAELNEFEQSGQTPARLNLAALAAAVGLNGAKLAELAAGWLPATTDLSTWRELRWISNAQDGNTVNCYIVWDEVTREAALFDTGWVAEPIVDLVTKNELELKHLFLTHTHEDHIAAMGELRKKYPRIRLHSNAKDAPVDQRNRPHDFIHVGSLRITHRDTPGHSEDGVTYVIGGFPEDAPHVAIVGDAIFAGSMGRGFQSTDLLKQKIREQIFTLPPNTLLCPGHGPPTTVAEELAHNPFF
jgi:glyoxylase-like metal-dependent hydrolase (beta-lactamase superfamily II)